MESATEITHYSHYVPRATVRRWSNDDVSVEAYRVLVSHENVPLWSKQSIRGIVRLPDLYTTLQGDQETDAFEKSITRLYEEPGQDAIEKLLQRRQMSPLDWRRIALFVALQQMRTPLYFLEMVKRLNQEIPGILADVVRDHEKRRDENSAEDVSAQRSHNHIGDALRVSVVPAVGAERETAITAEVSSTRAVWVSTILSLLQRRGDVICQNRWRAIEPAGDAEWPLTDHPVLTLNYYGQDRYDFGAGWAKKGSEFILPVSPRLAVCTQVGHSGRGPRAMTEEQTRGIQRFMAERALRWIIARRPEEWVASLRPRTVNAEAFATEQDAWKRWHECHVESEMEFRARQAPVVV